MKEQIKKICDKLGDWIFNIIVYGITVIFVSYFCYVMWQSL